MFWFHEIVFICRFSIVTVHRPMVCMFENKTKRCILLGWVLDRVIQLCNMAGWIGFRTTGCRKVRAWSPPSSGTSQTFSIIFLYSREIIKKENNHQTTQN